MNESSLKEALSSVKYPGFSRDIVSFGLVKKIEINESEIFVKISVATSDPKVPEQIFKEAHWALDPIAESKSVKIDIEVQNPQAKANSADGQAESIPGVKHIIAVASGKGGVGKSTVASNLALSLAKNGAKVGLCDCDLYGPSVAQIFGTQERPHATEDEKILPVEAHGLKLMSMGFLLDDSSPVIVRGPLATRYTQQFLRQVEWGELDYLILDLPPGTGDIQLTIVQTVSLTGAIIVTTPQEMALIDARKAVSMFAKVNVDILGVIENMSWFECNAGKKYHLFGEGGGKREAERMKVPLLGQIPIEESTRRGADEGRPVALAAPDQHPIAAAFAECAQKTTARIERLHPAPKA